jgi:hypothetical protein
MKAGTISNAYKHAIMMHDIVPLHVWFKIIDCTYIHHYACSKYSAREQGQFSGYNRVLISILVAILFTYPGVDDFLILDPSPSNNVLAAPFYSDG